MGDFSTSDCSWKKMVIAKANNKWISTMKLEHSEVDNPLSVTEQSSIREQISSENVKREPEENSDDDNYEISITQVMDPLALLQPGKPRLQAAKCNRRKSSGGSKFESPEGRARRLAKMSAYAAQRLANETPAQRANRLKRMSEYAAKRLAHETTDQRAKRLSRMSAYAAKRLASETAEQRQARLARMSAYAARRQAMKKMSNFDTSGFTGNSLQTDIMPNQS